MQNSVKKLTRVHKLLITFALVPVAPAAIICCLVAIAYLASFFSSSSLFGSAPKYGVLFGYAYLIAGKHVLFLGIPAFLVGLRFNALRWWTCMIIAFLIGFLPILLSTWYANKLQYGWQTLLPWGLYGVSGGLTFWLLWRFWIHWSERANT